MRSSPIAVLLLATLLVLGGGVVAADDTTDESDETPGEADGLAHVIVGDVVIGEDEQLFGPMRVAGVDENDEVVVEIDLTPLERRGVDVESAEVDLTDEDVIDASLETATVEDGVVTLAFDPDRRGFVVDEFQLTGLDTMDADARTDVAYDVAFSHGDGEAAERFALIDPDEVTPTADARSLYFDLDRQVVHVADVQPAADVVTVELDVSALEAHDIAVDDLSADAEADGAAVRTTTVRDGVVTVELDPAEDAVLFDVLIQLTGFDTTDVDADGAVHAEDVAYDVAIEGDADDAVDVTSFDLVAETPTAVADDHDEEPAETAGDEPSEETAPLGVGPVLVAIVLTASLFVRRSRSS